LLEEDTVPTKRFAGRAEPDSEVIPDTDWDDSDRVPANAAPSFVVTPTLAIVPPDAALSDTVHGAAWVQMTEPPEVNVTPTGVWGPGGTHGVKPESPSEPKLTTTESPDVYRSTAGARDDVMAEIE
jgi:hypothetical protein